MERTKRLEYRVELYLTESELETLEGLVEESCLGSFSHFLQEVLVEALAAGGIEDAVGCVGVFDPLSCA